MVTPLNDLIVKPPGANAWAAEHRGGAAPGHRIDVSGFGAGASAPKEGPGANP